MPAIVDELALPVLDGEQRGHHRLALVVGAAEEIARVGDLLVDAILGGAVPVDRERPRLLHHRAQRQATPVEMMPCTQSTFSCCTSFWKRSMVSLGDVSSSITSSILRPAMPPLRVETLDRPLRGADSILARGRRNAGARRQDADAYRLVLRDGRSERRRI